MIALVERISSTTETAFDFIGETPAGQGTASSISDGISAAPSSPRRTLAVAYKRSPSLPPSIA